MNLERSTSDLWPRWSCNPEWGWEPDWSKAVIEHVARLLQSRVGGTILREHRAVALCEQLAGYEVVIPAAGLAPNLRRPVFWPADDGIGISVVSWRIGLLLAERVKATASAAAMSDCNPAYRCALVH